MSAFCSLRPDMRVGGRRLFLYLRGVKGVQTRVQGSGFRVWLCLCVCVNEPFTKKKWIELRLGLKNIYIYFFLKEKKKRHENEEEEEDETEWIEERQRKLRNEISRPPFCLPSPLSACIRRCGFWRRWWRTAAHPPLTPPPSPPLQQSRLQAFTGEWMRQWQEPI